MIRVFLFLLASSIILNVEAEPGVKHIVLCWLKEPTNQTQKEKVITASEELKSIPGIQGLKVGVSIPSNREIADDSFDIGLVMSFADIESMQNYLVHEEHVKRVQTVFAPSCERILVYDIQH